MNACDLLARLDRVRQTGAGKWVARCPAHDDRGPSLSIRETPTGTVLLNDFAGCSAAAIVAALGLQLKDLFPPMPSDRGPRFRAQTAPRKLQPPKPTRLRWWEIPPHCDDPAWRMFVARAIEERAWRCNVEPEPVRDCADSNPRLALAIIDDAATALREYARSEASA